MKCVKCGAKIPRDVFFCPSCGAKVEKQSIFKGLSGKTPVQTAGEPPKKKKEHAKGGFKLEDIRKQSITWILLLLSVATFLCLVQVPIAGAWNIYGLIYALLIAEAAGLFFYAAITRKKRLRVVLLSIPMLAIVALQIAFVVTDARGQQESAAWTGLSKGGWIAFAFLTVGFLIIFYGKKKEERVTWRLRTRLVPLALMVLVLLLGTGGILVSAGVITLPSFQKKSAGFSRKFEAYYEPFSEEDVCYQNGEYYVDSRLSLTAVDEATFDDVEELAGEYGGEIVSYISTTCDYQISFPGGKTYDELTELAGEFEENVLVESAVFSYVMQMDINGVDYTDDPWIDANDPTDDSGSYWDEEEPDGLNWWTEATEMLSTWRMNVDYSTVKVGIFDTMFDTTNKDLDDGLFAVLWNQDGVNVTSLYQEHDGEDDQDNYAHGTHVAGLIAAEAENDFGITGVSQNSELYGYAVGTEQSGTDWFDTFELKYALALMFREGVQVVNISMAMDGLVVDASNGEEYAEKYLETNCANMTSFLTKYIDAGYEFLIVKSAGNDSNHSKGESYDAKYDFLGAIEDPTVKSRIIIVGAADYKKHSILNYTEYNEANFSNVGTRVDVYAPGVDILSDLPENVTSIASGTSMATPIVTGIVALVWGANPDLTASEVKSIITIAGAWRVFSPNEDSKDKFNVNVISAYRAVRLAQSWSGSENEKQESSVVMGIIYDAADTHKYLTVTSAKLYDSDGSLVEELEIEKIADTYDSDDDDEDDAYYDLASYVVFLEPGSYSIEITVEGYDTLTKYFDVIEGDVLDIDFDMSQTRQIVLVLDRTGSMQGTPLEETKAAAVNFVESVLEEGRSQIAVVSFNTSATLLTDFTDDADVLETAINSMGASGGTNFEAGLKEAYELLEESQAFKQIIVLMSDGLPNQGLVGNALINYATTIKNDAIFLYTLGFFELLGATEKAEAQSLMEAIASDGCHYEADEAENIVFFFDDIADQVNGGLYIYIRIACPVDVTVTYDGETLSSSEEDLCTRTTFGTLTFENVDDGEETDQSMSSENQAKILRLQAGVTYDIEITGTGEGTMDYTIAYMDEDGNYSDYRYFEDIAITEDTVIKTKTSKSANASFTTLKVDSDGNGSYEQYFRAVTNAVGNQVHIGSIVWTSVGCVLAMLIVAAAVAGPYVRKKKKAAGQSGSDPKTTAD